MKCPQNVFAKQVVEQTVQLLIFGDDMTLTVVYRGTQMHEQNKGRLIKYTVYSIWDKHTLFCHHMYE